MNRFIPSFICIAVLTVFFSPKVHAQELNCKVQVNSEQISGTDKVIYENLKKEVQEFMNARPWSALQLKKQEKIDCSLFFIVKKRDGNTLTCELQIQSSRPVFGSNYTTMLLNTREDLSFDFQENQNLTFNEQSLDNNLTATLAFWSYVILGLDFDGFSMLGGTPFFQKAQEISVLAQASLGINWKAQEDKNHWGWINALTDDSQSSMRVLTYQYHRLGLDVMSQKAEEGRSQITSVLSSLKAVKQTRPRSPLLSNFLDTKADELANLYSKSNTQEKQVVFDLLTDIYPASANRLQGIKTKR